MRGQAANRWLSRIEGAVFHLLLLLVVALLGWLTQRHALTWDWSRDNRNTLHPASIELLQRLDAPLRITSFAPDNPELRERIRELIDRYRRASDLIEFTFINPTSQPAQARQLGIQVSGELVLDYQERSEKLRNLDEQSISNSIQRLLLQGDRWLVTLTGHGERRFDGMANHDLGEFGDELQTKGFRIQPLDLTEGMQVPDNTGVLIIADPRTPLLEGEVGLIQDYLERGGNLLWLTDPAEGGNAVVMQRLGEALDLEILPGTIVDAGAATLGLEDPAYAVVPRYPAHPATAGFDLLTLFPYAAALQMRESERWIQTPLLTTLERAWNETGPIRGEVQRDAEQGEQVGPLTIGLALERQQQGREQRILVIGDGDFLSNAFLGNGGNMDLGLNLIRWLASEDRLLSIPARSAEDIRLQLSPATGALIGFGFLLVLPLLFLAGGLTIWLRRRRR